MLCIKHGNTNKNSVITRVRNYACINALSYRMISLNLTLAWIYNNVALQELENQEGELKLALVQFDAEAASMSEKILRS